MKLQFLISLIVASFLPALSLSSVKDEFLVKLGQILLDELSEEMKKHQNMSEIGNQDVVKCVEGLTSNIYKNFPFITDTFAFCGKGLSDLGNERECTNYEKEKRDYFQLVYKVNETNMVNQEYEDVLDFLDQNVYYTGFCMLSECMPFLEKSFTDENSTFYNFISKVSGIKNFSIVLNKDEREKEEDKKEEKNIYKKSEEKMQEEINITMTIFFWIFVVYFSIKLLASLFRVIVISEGYKRAHMKNEIRISKAQKGLNSDNSRDNSNKELSRTESFRDSISSSTSTSSLQEKFYSSYIYIIEFFDFIDGFFKISSLKGKYYNDKGMEPLILTRVVVMFLLVYYQNIYTLIRFPGRDFLSTSFYESKWFIAIKIASYSGIFWIILDATIATYKLMQFIKKHVTKEDADHVKFIIFVKFFVYTIPKIVIFSVAYFIFIIASRQIDVLLPSSTMFQYYNKNIIGEMKCYKERKTPRIYAPFCLNYWDVKEDFFLNNCFRFVSVALNEYAGLIVISLYLYLSFRFKKPVMDYIVVCLVFLNMIFIKLYPIPGLSEATEENGLVYSVYHVFGHYLNEKLTHLFLNYYFLGAWIGIGFFHYVDSSSKNSISQKIYIPFGFAFKIIKFFDGIRWKRLFFFIVLILQVVLANSFSYLRYFNIKKDKDKESTKLALYLDKSALARFIFYYEKNIFGIFFCIVLIFIIVFPMKSRSIIYLITKNGLVPCYRTGTIFFYSIEPIIYLSYCVFIIQAKLSYNNLFFLTVGLISLLSIFCSIMTVMFEHPMRVLLKYLLRPKNAPEDELNKDKNGMNRVAEDNKGIMIP